MNITFDDGKKAMNMPMSDRYKIESQQPSKDEGKKKEGGYLNEQNKISDKIGKHNTKQLKKVNVNVANLKTMLKNGTMDVDKTIRSQGQISDQWSNRIKKLAPQAKLADKYPNDKSLQDVKSQYDKAVKNKEEADDLLNTAMEFKRNKQQPSKDEGKKEESKTKSANKIPTLDTFKDIAKQSKDVQDFMSKVREIKNTPADVAKEFNEKYGRGGELSPEQASKNFMAAHGKKEEPKVKEKPKKESSTVSNKTTKDLDSFGKQKLDNEKTETIGKLQNLASKIDEKYLSTKTKDKLAKLVDDIYTNAYEGELDSNLYKTKNIKESLSALKTLNNRLDKEGEYALEEDMVNKIQDVLVEAAKEQLNKKTTEKLQYKLF